MPSHERASHTEDLSEVTPAIADGPIEVLGLMPNASNATLLVRCGHGEDEEFAVYKPQRGETPLWDFPEGSLHLREVAAYEVARILGWPPVPATVLRDGPHGPGSVQRFVRFDADEHYFTLGAAHREAFARVAAFDLVVNNADRKGGHCLLGEDGGIWVIDHGVCFAVEPKLRTVIWDFIDEPLPAEVAGGLERLLHALEGDAAAPLARLLEPDEIAATRERAAGLLAAGAFPPPDPDSRPFPWPPILSLRAATFPTPLGPFTVVRSPTGVVATTSGQPEDLLGNLSADVTWTNLDDVGRELASYFDGRLRRFRTRLDLRLATTPFALAVLQVTASIPYGEMWTYGDVAGMAGRPGAARAAGSVLARSPIELFVPCHRVVPAGAGLGRYGGEEDRRLRLLRLEGAI